jgi:CheY-like chemotaxis protein
MRVLTVDSQQAARAQALELLASWRLRPVGAASAAEARALMDTAYAANDPFEMILIDTALPDEDPFTLGAECARRESANCKPRVILMAAAGQRGDAARCRELGISGYLSKPYLPSDLLDALTLATGLPEETDRALVTRHTIRESRRYLNLLVTDDNPINRALANRMLEKMGHKVTLANDGAEAVAAYQAHSFDAILMDVQMPVMGGFEATAEIRRLEQTSGGHIPIIAMTAHAMAGDRERCLEAGMDGYVAKPIHQLALSTALANATGTQNLAYNTRQPMVAPPCFDRAEMMERMGQDAELAQQLAEVYLEELVRMRTQLSLAVQNHDMTALYAAAHSIKGVVSDFCAHGAAESAQRLEMLAKTPTQAAEIAEAVATLDRAMVALGDALQQERWLA